MRPRVPFTAIALAALGVGVAANGILGPLVLGIIQPRISVTMGNQLVGGEIISLLLVAPLAMAAAVLWIRRHPLAAVLAIGPALYSVYTYVQFAVGPQFDRYPGNSERFFPLFLLLVVLGWTTALSAWRALSVAPMPPVARIVRWMLGVLLVAANGGFAIAWASSIHGVLTGRAFMAEYQLDQTLFWLIRLMDLGFVIPIGVVIGFGLMANRGWATRAAYAFGGLQVLLSSAVASMAIVMILRRDPAADPVMVWFTVGITLGLASAYGLFVVGARTLSLAREDRHGNALYH
jgi:hypothetical protein